ncbi:MAG: major facilitator superfamily protein [Microgenomates group bacterium Gr01-1014_7]|nr:MAG: major facilitator superfamily protein [Microgenomates group bacterium Gr01-1014_7]
MPPKISPLLALKVSHFRNYLFGAFVSDIGSQMQIVAVSWQVYEMTGNPASLGLIGVANFVPILLFSLVGGLVADKVDRKKLLIITYSLQTIIAFTLFLLSFTHLINPALIYLILVLVSTVQSFSLPGRQAVLPNLVPKKYFMNAVSLQTLQFQGATMIGPAIAGILIGGFGVPSVYLLNALSFLFFIGVVFSLKIALQSHDREVEFSLSSISEGVKFVAGVPILYTTMILDFLATFFGTATILMPVFAKDVLHVGPQGLGLLYSAPAIGGVLAGFVLSSWHQVKNQGKVIITSIILYGLATIGFGLSNAFPVSIFFLILVGFGDMLSTIIRNTIRQMVTPDHLRGRMSSVMRIFFQGGPQLGEIEAGFLAKAIGGPATVVIGGMGVILITSLVAWKSKELRTYHGKELAV